LASDFRAVWLVWLKVGERASGKAFGAKTLRLMLRFRELLNQVWGLKGCRQNAHLRKNRSVRFGFGKGTVLVACRGDQVSCYTTVGFGVRLIRQEKVRE
jgi:hypothetical protein